MSANYGITTEIKSSATRDIKVESQTKILLAAKKPADFDFQPIIPFKLIPPQASTGKIKLAAASFSFGGKSYRVAEFESHKQSLSGTLNQDGSISLRGLSSSANIDTLPSTAGTKYYVYAEINKGGTGALNGFSIKLASSFPAKNLSDLLYVLIATITTAGDWAINEANTENQAIPSYYLKQLLRFDNAAAALKDANFSQPDSDTKDSNGRSALLDIDAQNANCPIVISLANTALAALDYAKAELKNKFGFKPDIILATGECAETGVSAKLSELAKYFSCVALYDMQADSVLTALDTTSDTSELNGLGDRLMPIYGSAETIRREQTYTRPLSALVAGLIARTDGSQDFGWGYSPSNRQINGIIKGGTSFEAGQTSDADNLRHKGINCLIREQGFRLWGDNVINSEPSFRDIKRLRIFDKLAYTMLRELFWAVDKNAYDVLPYVKTSVVAFLNRLKGSGILLGFEVSWNDQLNTNSEIANGRFYLDVDAQEMPSVKRLKITFNYVDRYGDVLLQLLNS